MMKKKIKNFFKYFDFFGTFFYLRYKGNKKYKSSFGGITFFFFIITTLIYSIISFHSFFKKDNISIIYYNTQISPTDNFSFYNYSYGIGFLGVCETNNDIFSKLFKYDLTYVIMNNSNKETKRKYKIGIHKCNNSDFFNKSTQVLDSMGVNNIYYCPDYTINGINGIYTDEIFSYFQLSVKAKYIQKEDYDTYYNFLTINDCKLHLFFPTLSINIYNFHQPFDYAFYDLFFQINPKIYIKRNIFYKIYQFQSSIDYFFDTYKTDHFIDYSKYDDYILYKSKESFFQKYEDFDVFAKVYFRADSVRTFIERKYQKISECIAQISGIFSTLFIFLRLIISYINNFNANNNIYRNIYKFKELKDTESYTLIQNIRRKLSIKKIKRLEKISINAEFGNFKPDQSVNKLKLNFLHNHLHSYESKIKNENKFTLNMKDDKKENELNEKNESYYYFSKNDNNIDYKIASNNRSNINSSLISSFNNSKSPFGFNFNNLKTGNNNNNNKKYIIKKKEISLKFSIKETFLYLFCCFKLSNPVLQKKIKYLHKAQSIFYENLDIQIYFKKMIFIELLSYITFEPYENYILKFLEKPSISIYDYNLSLMDYFNRIYKSDYKKNEEKLFLKSYNKLIDIRGKTIKERKLSNIINIEMGHLFS